MAASEPSFTAVRSRSIRVNAGRSSNPPSPSTSAFTRLVTAYEGSGAFEEHEEPESYGDNDIASLHTGRQLFSEPNSPATPSRHLPSGSETVASQGVQNDGDEIPLPHLPGDPDDIVQSPQKASWTPILPPGGYQGLDFRPALLETKITILLTILYLMVAAGIALLLYASGQDRKFYVASENIHLVAQYVPGLTATATMLLFRQTAIEAIRMIPYVAMADQKGSINRGASAKKSVAGAYFPWTTWFSTPKSPLTHCLFPGSFIVSFLVAAKSILLGTTTNGSEWIVFVRPRAAYFLMVGYGVMAFCNLMIVYCFRSKSTGLRWDPISLTDFIALFATCDALQSFKQLEYNRRPNRIFVHDKNNLAENVLKHGLPLRLGYWECKFQASPGAADTKVVYGIGLVKDRGYRGATGNVNQRSSIADGPAESGEGESPRLNSNPAEDPTTLVPIDRRRSARAVADGSPIFTKPIELSRDYADWFTDLREPLCGCENYPGCAHYPYRISPGLSPVMVTFWMIIGSAALFACVYVLAKGTYRSGFSMANNWGGFGRSTGNETLPANDLILDTGSSTFLYALVFRAIPAQLAGWFAIGFLGAVDLNMRFMQPFLGMLEIPCPAAESISLSYLTASAVDVPLQAYQRGHYKVAWFSILNTVSPLFPIVVSALFTITTTPTHVFFTFTRSSFVLIIVYTTVYCISLLFIWPRRYRRIPRMPLSLADLMGMCHQAQVVGDDIFDIASPKMTREKLHAKVLLRDYKYLFGWYHGRDGHRHLGFDVAETDQQGPLHNVRWVPPKDSWIRKGKASLVDRTFRRRKAKVNTLTGANEEDYELDRVATRRSADGTEVSESSGELHMHGALPAPDGEET